MSWRDERFSIRAVHRSIVDHLYSVRSAIGLASLVLGAWYAALVGIHASTLQAPASIWVAGAAAITALSFVVVGLRWWRSPPSEQSVDACVASLAFAILANDAIYLYFSPDPHFLHGLGAVWLGSGLFLSSRAWYALVGGGVVAVAVATVLHSGENAEWLQPAILLFTNGVLATVIQVWRIAYSTRVDSLHAESERRGVELEQSMIELARHQDDLEDIVEQRTRELLSSRDQLREAEKLAAVGTLTAGIAHQINNPIGAILVSTEYALLCEDDGNAQAIWKMALRTNLEEAQRCASIVHSLLQFTRKEPIEKTMEDLNQVVRRASAATAKYVRDRSAAVELDLTATPLPVFMSPIEMEQVLINVIRNGVESQVTGARIDIRTARRGELAVIQLRDNGHGIAPEIRSRIFDPFFSTRVGRGGTGLGLSVAHGIVKDHGGEIRIESESEKGTTVIIEIPLSEAAAPHEPI